MLVVDKPVGLVTADPTRREAVTLFGMLKDRSSNAARRPRARSKFPPVIVVHRLDKEASGLVVFAKTERAFNALKEDFRTKRMRRLYLAVAEGSLGKPGDAGTHQSFLDEDDEGTVVSLPAGAYRGAPGRNAKLAVTHYRVIASAKGLSLIQVRLDTGRKNQIRVHMRDLQHPLAGDARFGARGDPLKRLGLHASELGFSHPATGREMRFFSPAPASFYASVGMEPPAVQGEAGSLSESEGERAASGHAPRVVRPPRGAAGELRSADTSWNEVATWYDDYLGQDASSQGSDHYENVVLPGALRLLAPRRGQRILDIACGQGILSRRLVALGVDTTGIDAAPDLIEAARRRSSDAPAGSGAQTYEVADARNLGPLGLSRYDSAACIMALTNIDPLEPVFKAVAEALLPAAPFVCVIAHPAFRVPRQTSWGWDKDRAVQYRRVDGYLSASQTAIQMHPGAAPNVTTITFHRPIQAYFKALSECGWVVDAIEEWPGVRRSTSGPRAAEENRARREIPLFLAIRARSAPACT